MVRRERVAGATSEGFSLFSVFGHRELVAYLLESHLRKSMLLSWTTNRTNHTNVGLSVFLFVTLGSGSYARQSVGGCRFFPTFWRS